MVRLGFGKEIDLALIFSRVQTEKELAISKKIKVGCVIAAVRRGPQPYSTEIEYFGGSNIELSTTYVYHAEMIALTDCIMHRFWPIKLYVSSQSVEENTFLCGDCRQQLLEVNKDCEVIVFNPDGKIKGKNVLHELLPKHKNVEAKNNKYYQMLYEGEEIAN